MKKNDEGKEAECLYDTSYDDTEEGVNDRNDNKNEKYDEEKESDEITDYHSTKIIEVKGVVDERGGKDLYLDEFYLSTCSGGSFYGIFNKEEQQPVL